MPLPPEIERELESWLDARLDERFRRERERTRDLVLEIIKRLLQHEGGLYRRELDQEFANIRTLHDELLAAVEKLTRLSRATDEPPDADGGPWRARSH